MIVIRPCHHVMSVRLENPKIVQSSIFIILLSPLPPPYYPYLHIYFLMMIIVVCFRRGGDDGRCGGQHHPPVPGGCSPGCVLSGVVLQVSIFRHLFQDKVSK